jgi:hypothetical protein
MPFIKLNLYWQISTKGVVMAIRWSKSDGVVWEQLGGETVIVRPSDRRTWLLNATASFVWRCCNGQVSPEEIARRLGGQQVTREIAAFCQDLAKLGLLSESTQPAPQPALALAFSGPYAAPRIMPQGFGTGPRRRPSPRGLSGPG